MPAPLSRLELDIAGKVPRLATAIIVYDGGEEGFAQRAATRLRELGYGDVSVLSGGLAAWAASGFEVFTDSNVAGKAFGEFVEHVYGTPHITVADLKARLGAAEHVVVLDSRPLSEFRAFSIPGAIDCPGAELVYRVHEVVRSPETLVVVNCAGRTRSIIGAQALINAGIPNPVASLQDGTMAWLLNGYELDHDETRSAPPAPRGAAPAKARQSAERLAARFGLRAIDRDTLARFRAEAAEHSLYLLDVRTAEEYEAGHLPGARWAPGGQLVQALDQWVGTRNARIVLFDTPDRVRSAITAPWLIQIGWGDVFVHAEPPLAGEIATGPEPAAPAAPVPPMATLTSVELQDLLDAGEAVVVDVGGSPAYRAGVLAST